MSCELCGREVEEFVSAVIEGSTLQVCSNCSKFGQVVERKGKINVKPIKQVKRSELDDIEFIVPKYSALIKEARERKGLTQEELAKNINEKVSLIHQVESGHMKPDLNLALKIGKYFEIRLVEKYVEADVKELQIDFKNKNLTIGDLIKFKKNEKDSINVCKENLKMMELDGEVFLKDVNLFDKKVDTVLQNPPFGVQVEHADKRFLERAMVLSNVIYSIHKIESEKFIKKLSRDRGFVLEGVKSFRMKLKKTQKFHTSDSYSVKVGCFRIIKNLKI